jgi:putative NIF3 family GTP cyclohydrolase 1 type 2
MKLSQFYDKVIKYGIEADPRKDKTSISSYADTAVLHGPADREIRKIFVGIDIDVSELLLADRIRSQRGLDMVVSHHPQGSAYASLFNVMQVQVDQLEYIGIPRKTAQEMLDERKREVERKILPANHMRAVDAAKLLDIAFICCHTPADNHAYSFVNKTLNDAKPKKLGQIVDVLKAIPEYDDAEKNCCGPRIIMGNPNRHTGEIFVEMTGGTEGPKDVYDKLYKAGIRTLVSMHLSEDHFKKVLDTNLNVVIAGHISSDTLGLNLLLDKIEREQKFSIVSCSGFRRIRRIQF